MPPIVYVGIFCMLMLSGYLFGSMIYSMIITYKQSKKFINELKIGDESNFGTISGIEGDEVIINREPLRIKRNIIQPQYFKAKRFFFMFSNNLPPKYKK